MPTILIEDGFRFMVFFDDHVPAHVHVWKSGALARIEIGNVNNRPTPLDSGSMRTTDLRRAVRIVEARQDEFLAAWRMIHGNS